MCAGRKEGGVDACQVWEFVDLYILYMKPIEIINNTDCPFGCFGC